MFTYLSKGNLALELCFNITLHTDFHTVRLFHIKAPGYKGRAPFKRIVMVLVLVPVLLSVQVLSLSEVHRVRLPLCESSTGLGRVSLDLFP